MYIYMVPMLLSMIFVNLNHPMLLMVNIIMQTIFICLLVWMINNTSWFSYILFLIFLGGLMVLFIYICSLASNENFKVKINLKFIIPTIILMTAISSQFTSSQEVSMVKNFYKMMSETTYPNSNWNILSLITLIVVVKITGNNMGPIRMTKN
uniref:NADH-ubiquinone oxidoreductase chain 6 n=1 Tax=Dicyrtomina saundersi TaxID=438492 RepID=A0A516EZT5_9HEXA|nr:NADH dehydrogenase subunit 6 [Dicyrtomina saundersi]QDO72019.1 NADH dehydrogenase subunit 6 [Dicyrtomina saundersi]